LLIVGRVKFLRQRLALGVFDIFQHIPAQRALHETLQAGAQRRQICAALHVLAAEGGFVAELEFIDQRGQAV